jgi:hypothetical protein
LNGAPESAGARQPEQSMYIRAILVLLAGAAAVAHGANTPPVSDSWNIASSGTASSSGELLFRVTPGDGSDATEVTVFVLSGTNDTGVASNIRRAMSTQLRGDRFNVQPGENANVLLTNGGRGNGFSIELLDSDVESVRVVVQSAAPVAPPTVPEQATPATPPQGKPVTPPASGDAAAPATPSTPSPSPAPSAPTATPAGAAATAPPPP